MGLLHAAVYYPAGPANIGGRISLSVLQYPLHRETGTQWLQRTGSECQSRRSTTCETLTLTYIVLTFTILKGTRCQHLSMLVLSLKPKDLASEL